MICSALSSIGSAGMVALRLSCSSLSPRTMVAAGGVVSFRSLSVSSREQPANCFACSAFIWSRLSAVIGGIGPPVAAACTIIEIGAVDPAA